MLIYSMEFIIFAAAALFLFLLLIISICLTNNSAIEK